MEVLYKTVAFITCLGVLIAVHEWGHFFMARRHGVRVEKFSIGFGKPLFSWRDRLGTEFIIAAIPLGGYVKMLGEPGQEIDVSNIEGSFAHKRVSQRFSIVAAGPVVNLVFAVLLYWALFVSGMTGMVPRIGEITPDSAADLAGVVSGGEVIAIDGNPVSTWEEVNLSLVDRIGETGTIVLTVREHDSSITREYALAVTRFMTGREKEPPLDQLGIEGYMPPVDPVIGEVLEGKAAERQGFLAGDRLISIDGEPLKGWKQWVTRVRASPGVTLQVEIERDGQRRVLSLTPDAVETDEGVIGQIGAAPEPIDVPDDLIRTYSYGPVEGLGRAVVHTADLVGLTLGTLGKMVTGDVSLESLSGPITIARLAGESALFGLESFLSFTAYLSISLGVLNLLPIPVLDGGHLMFYLVEWIKGSPVSERIQQLGQTLGLGLLMMFMGLALYNDVLSF